MSDGFCNRHENQLFIRLQESEIADLEILL